MKNKIDTLVNFVITILLAKLFNLQNIWKENIDTNVICILKNKVVNDMVNYLMND